MARLVAQWRTLWLLASLAALAHAKESEGDDDVDLGPAMPGEDRYWLKLKYISYSEGSVSPHFDPDRNDYELTIHNQEVESFTMTLSLELSKYNLLFLPRIEINGNNTVYTPLHPITHVVYVNHNEGPEDRIVYVKLVDPIGTTRGLFGIPKPPRANEYRIRVLQPPEFDEVVKLDDLEVSLEDGSTLKPVREDKEATGQFWFTLPANQKGAYIKANCNRFSTQVLVNGESVGQGQKVWQDLHVPHITWMAECLYDNNRWSQSVLGRTYQVHVSHLKDSFDIPKVHLMPQDGKCTQEETDDPKSPKGYICRTTTRTLDLIVTFDTTSVEVFMVQGGREANVISGIQTRVVLPADEVNWYLRVQGAHNVEVPLHIVVAQQCTALTCPVGWVPKPALDQGENAVLHLCHGVTCNLEDDATTCCREAGSPCEDYGQTFQCPAGRTLFKLGFCWGTPCQASDKHYCCQAAPSPSSGGKEGAAHGTGQFDMNIGAWKDWFRKQDEQAKKVTTTLGDHIDFAVQIKAAKKGDDSNKEGVQEMKAVEKVLQDSIAQNVGTVPDHIKLTAQPSRDKEGDPAVTFAVDISSLSGSSATNSIFTGAQKFVKGDNILKAVQTGMQEKGVSGSAAVQVPWKSKVTRRIAPHPSIEVGLDVQISKAADLGRQGNEEELQPEIVAAIKTAILGVADLPDKEKMKLHFKKLPATTAVGTLPDGDEMIHVVGNITLPHGKEGSKEILEAKFRNPVKVVQKLNQIMESVVAKDEKQEGSHVVGKKSDYKVTGLNLGRVSKSAVDSMAAGGLMNAPTGKPAVTKAGALKAWLKLEKTTTTPPVVSDIVQIATVGGQCITAPNSRKMRLHATVSRCNELDHRQAWFYHYKTGALQSAFGVCLSADLNGPPPSMGHAPTAQVLQQWVAYRGPAPTLQWACDGGWGQTWTYEPGTGLFRLTNTYEPGLCLQASDMSSLAVALCDGRKFSQQFWFSAVDAMKLMPTNAKTAVDVPIFAKPYFDGEESVKSEDATYDNFKLAKFAKTRALWYLSQGCSPVPTASCGTPAPDMPGVYVGESVLQLGKKMETLPWQSAMSTSPVEGSDLAMCYYDHSCATQETGPAALLKQWTKGCNAGGKPSCRYCGTGSLGECPKHYECGDGGLHKGTWTQEHKDWCCKKFSIGCEKPYHCIQGLDHWRKWDQKRKDWCCAYQLLGCEDECDKTDPATFRENHHFWCSSFGAPEKKDDGPTPFERFEKMLEQMYEEPKAKPRISKDPKLLPVAGGSFALVVSIVLFLSLSAAGVWRAAHRVKHRTLERMMGDSVPSTATEPFTSEAHEMDTLVAA